MQIYIILTFVFWVLMGLQAIAPHISGGSFDNWKPGVKVLILFAFILLGPLIAICNIINVIILFFCGPGEDDDSGVG